MEKESVKKFDLEAAFKALDEIDVPVAEKGIKANRVDLKERFSHKPAYESLVEDYYDVSSTEDLEEAQDEREGEVAQAKLARIEKIVDLDAESPEDLLPSYVGKVIMQCPQCMTLFYKNPEDIEHSEENPDVVNINEVCQHCGNTSGYTLIGKVDSVGEDEADKYEAAEASEAEDNELDLDFDLEEVPMDEGEEDLDLDLDLDLEGEGEEEVKAEEAFNAFGTMPLNEDAANESVNNSEVQKDAEEGSELKTENESENLTLNEDTANESVNNSEAQKEAEDGSELKTENESENLTLNEEVEDKDLDKKLAAHNEYIEYLRGCIAEKEEALKKAENEEIKAAIEKCLEALKADLEAALPDAVKDLRDNVEEIPEVVEAEEVVEEPTEEAPSEELPVEGEPAEEALTEEAEDEKPEGKDIDYVEYKHSYCHALAPKLKQLNYVVNVLGWEADKVKKLILGTLKNSADVKWTAKEKEFVKNIKEKTDPKDIYQYVKNSIEKAKTIIVKVDEAGELVEGLNEGFEGCVFESLNNSEALKDAENGSELKTENESENLTLNESLALTEDEEAEIAKIINSWSLDDAIMLKPMTNEAVEDEANVAAEIDKEVATWLEPDADEAKTECLKEEDEIPAEEDPVDGEPSDEEPEEAAATAREEALNVLEDKIDVHGEDDTIVIAEKGQLDNPDAPKIEVEVSEEEKEILEPEFHEEANEEAKSEETEEVEECGKAPIEGEPLKEAAEDALDTLLDDKEFQTPVSDAEVQSYFDEEVENGQALEEGLLDAKHADKLFDADGSTNIYKVICMSKPGEGETATEIAADARLFKDFASAEKYAKAYSSHKDHGITKIITVIAKDDEGNVYVLRQYDNGKLVAGSDTLTALITGAKQAAKEKKANDKIAKKTDKLSKGGDIPGDIPRPDDATIDAATDLAAKYKLFIGEISLGLDEATFADALTKAKTIATKSHATINIQATRKSDGKNYIIAYVNKAGKELADNNEILASYANGTEAVKTITVDESFNLDDVEELDEASLNSHINSFLKEVYSNVEYFEATNCNFTDKLIIEGYIKFNSGITKQTVFEFLPAFENGNLFFEGINKEFSDEKAFRLNCSINTETKSLLTESFGYKYTVDNNTVEGTK